MKYSKVQIGTTLLAAWVSFVFLQSLFFKFQGHEETEIIFNTIGTWMENQALLSWAAPIFAAVGGYAIGGSELIATIMLWIAKTRRAGAALGVAVMSGAIFFHLFTPLGVVRKINSAGDTDGGALFIMACTVWLSCAAILYLTRPVTSSNDENQQG